MTTMQLSDRQERFIHEYLLDLNAAAAARRAGYAGSTRGKQAADLMKHPLIRERIDLALAEMFAALDITAMGLMRERARAAFFRAERMFDEAGMLLPLTKMDEGTRAALTVHQDVRPDGKATLRIRQPDRMKALAALEKAYACVMGSLRAGLAPEGVEEAEEPQEVGIVAETEAVGAEAEPEGMGSEAELQGMAIMEPAQGVQDARRPQARPVEAGSREAAQAWQPERAASREPASRRPTQSTPAASRHDEPYDFRKDPEWMLGGKYRDPDFPRPWRNAAPAEPPVQASGLAAAVRRVFSGDYVPPWDRHKAGNPATQPTLR